MEMTLGSARKKFIQDYSKILTEAQINEAVNWFGQLHNDGYDDPNFNDGIAARAAIALVKLEAGMELTKPEATATEHPIVKRYLPKE